MREHKANWKHTTPEQLLASHLNSRRSSHTARCYRGDVETLAEFLEAATAAAAVRQICELTRGAAERTMHDYVAWLRNRYGSVNTIRRKAQSIMGMLRLAHRFDVVGWSLKPLELPVAKAIRDTRGPDRDTVEQMIELCDGRNDAKGARDSAILSLMAWAAMRCNEVLSLDLAHVDIDARQVELLAKGLWGREWNPIPTRAAMAIERWLSFRGYDDGPLFTSMHRNRGEASRMTYQATYDMVRKLAVRVGGRCSPHKLRHFAATEHLRLSRGDVPWAMALTRHRDPKTLMIYNDERGTRARDAMELISAGHPIHRLGGPTVDN